MIMIPWYSTSLDEVLIITHGRKRFNRRCNPVDSVNDWTLFSQITHVRWRVIKYFNINLQYKIQFVSYVEHSFSYLLMCCSLATEVCMPIISHKFFLCRKNYKIISANTLQTQESCSYYLSTHICRFPIGLIL